MNDNSNRIDSFPLLDGSSAKSLSEAWYDNNLTSFPLLDRTEQTINEALDRSEIKEQGRKAYLSGRCISDNPYVAVEIGGKEHLKSDAWMDGYKEAKEATEK